MKSIKRWAKSVQKIAFVWAASWLIGFAMMSGGIVAAQYHNVAVAIAFEE